MTKVSFSLCKISLIKNWNQEKVKWLCDSFPICMTKTLLTNFKVRTPYSSWGTVSKRFKTVICSSDLTWRSSSPRTTHVNSLRFQQFATFDCSFVALVIFHWIVHWTLWYLLMKWVQCAIIDSIYSPAIINKTPVTLIGLKKEVKNITVLFD